MTIFGKYGILKTHAGPAGAEFTVSNNPMIKGRYRTLPEAKRHADRLHAMVVDLTKGNAVVYTSSGAEEAFQTGRAGPVGRLLNRADRKVDELEAKTHGRGTGYRANRGGGW
jgi:hypothetical protein